MIIIVTWGSGGSVRPFSRVQQHLLNINEGKDSWLILSHGYVEAIKYTLYGHDRDIFMTSKPIKIS